MPDVLTDHEVETFLKDLPAWSREGGSISRSVRAPSFLAGIDLVRAVADAAEAEQHHPDIDIRWTTVTFTLSTHSAGGLTGKDLAMAARIDALADEAV